MKTLRERFEIFIQTLDGFESIDELLKNTNLLNKKRADYFLKNRSIIVEQKSLEIDPIDKPQKFVDGLIDKGQILFYGTLSSERLFSNLPNGKDLQRQLVLKVTEVIEDNVEKANKQTRD